MITQIYVSTASWLLSTAELLTLLTQSQANNRRRGITGMLLYKGGNFMQALEGEADVVHSLATTIARDPRHYDVITIYEAPIATRTFADWSMAFRNLNDPAVQATSGYSPFLNTPLTVDAFGDQPAAAQQLLRVFKEQIR